MEVSTEIKKAFEALLTQQEFCQHIEAYTQSALQTIFGQPQSQEIDCPPPYIFVLNHTLQNNQNIDSFLSLLPQTNRNSVAAIINEYLDQQEDLRIDNTLYSNLSDIRWTMSIQNGRQVYEVQLFTFQSQQPFTMKLNYEQLSILSFQVTQAVARLSNIADP